MEPYQKQIIDKALDRCFGLKDTLIDYIELGDTKMVDTCIDSLSNQTGLRPDFIKANIADILGSPAADYIELSKSFKRLPIDANWGVNTWMAGVNSECYICEDAGFGFDVILRLEKDQTQDYIYETLHTFEYGNVKQLIKTVKDEICKAT